MNYLVEFNDAINKVVKTHGLNLNNDGTFRIDYINEPTQEELNTVNNLINNYQLFCKKMEKLTEIDNQWAELEKVGWDSGQGYSLGITPNDVALLVGAFSLAKEAVALGLPLPSLVSMNNTPITFNSIGDMTVLLLQYGNARATLSSSFAARRKAVELATTIDEVIGV